MEIALQTERLILRYFTIEDAALLFELNKDPDVTRYTLDPMISVDQAKMVLEQTILPQYALYGLGRWAVLLKVDHSFIGWCGLKRRPELNEIDLGYRFLKQHWGRGYATESAYGCIRYGFGTLGLPEITGRALPGNLASIHVLEKCGMTYRGEQVIEGLLHKTYDISNPLIKR